MGRRLPVAAGLLWFCRLVGCLHLSVTRLPLGGGDIFTQVDAKPSKCAQAATFCPQFGAVANSQAPGDCQCQCGPEAPVFLQDSRRCANSLTDCQQLEFHAAPGVSSAQRRIPTFYVPSTTQILNFAQPVDWRGVDITTGPDSCRLHSCEFLTEDGWKPLAPNSLVLVTANGQSFLQWLTEEPRERLSGKVFRVNLACHNHSSSQFCLAFRFAGLDAELPDAQRLRADDQNRLGLAIGVTFGCLLIATILPVLAFWLIWTRRRRQRRKSAADRQLRQLWRQQRQLQELEFGVNFYSPALPDFSAYQQQPEILSSAYNSPPLSHRSWRGVEAPEPQYLEAILPPRRRLHLSPELLDPQITSAVTVEFLTEIRQMIDVAKLRIRRRRFVPALEAIVEERSSSGSPELTVAKSAESDSTGDSGVETTRASPALPADRTTDERLKVADWLLTAANSYVEPPRDYEDAEVLPPCRRLGHFGSVPHRRRQLSSSDPDRPSPSASLPRRRRSGDSRRPLSPALFLVPLKPLAEFGDFTF